MSKKVKKTKRRSPKVFLILTLLFCAALTYFWNVWYIPYLPKSEVPPFLTDAAAPTTAETVHSTAAPAVTDVKESTQAPTSPAPMPDIQTAAPKETAAAAITTVQSKPAETPASDIYARRDGVYNFLVVGKDDAASNTDVLMLLSFDTENGSASVVQIPRDTYIDGYKINALWAKYSAAARRQGSADARGDGMRKLCNTLETTLCVRIDHWVFCSLAALRETVDALGGVTLEVPCDMDYEDPAQNLEIHLKKGLQTLDGAHAEQFVRFRSGYLRGDLGRVEAQKLFLCALLDSLRDVSVLSLPSLIATAAKHVDLSLGAADILFFAKAAQKLDMQKVTFLTLPGTDCRANGNTGAWYYVLSREGTWEAVNRCLNVYETPVDGKLFDKNYRLTDAAKPTLLSYYRKHISPDFQTGTDIAENGISIPTT